MNSIRQNQGKAPSERRVDVVVTDGPDGARAVLLRDMSHSEGVGWYVQRTIRLDATQVDALLRSLCCAKQVCCGTRRPSNDTSDAAGSPSGKIVQLTSVGLRS